MSRNTAGPGLIYAEGQLNGRFTTYQVSPDVHRAYENIQRDYPNLRCLWDNENHEHIIIEHCLDDVQRLVLRSRTFHEDLIRVKLNRADSTKFDVMDEIEEAEKAANREEERKMADLTGEAGEKLAKAFADDGLTERTRMTPLSVRMKPAKRLRNFEAPKKAIRNR